MTSILFRVIATAANIGVWLTEWGFQATVWLANHGFGITRWLIVQGAAALMKLVDIDTWEEAQAELLANMELEQQGVELALLGQATKLKEHALSTGEWTDRHTASLEAIGNQLLNQCGWDEDAIHQYLKEVVEDGTDLSYNAPEPDPWDEE